MVRRKTCFCSPGGEFCSKQKSSLAKPYFASLFERILKMLFVMSKNQITITKVNDYSQLTKFFCTVENHKLFEDHPQFGKTHWSFQIYSRQRVREMARHDPNPKTREHFKKAAGQDLEMLEICMGDFNNACFVLLRPDTNLQALQEKWCHDYCRTHQYKLMVLDDRILCQSDQPVVLQGSPQGHNNPFSPVVYTASLPEAQTGVDVAQSWVSLARKGKHPC
jgi:hypothetical protein